MKPLATNFTHKGMIFKQIQREGDVALFEKGNVDGGSRSLEVIRVRKYPTYEIGGAVIEAHESFPPTSAWGKEGWTYSINQLPIAEDKYLNELIKGSTSAVMGESNGGVKGRVRSTFEVNFPTSGTFCIKDLPEAATNESLTQLRLREALTAGTIRVARKVKSPSGKGRLMNIYEVVK